MSTVLDSEAAGAVKELLWLSRKFHAMPDNDHWAALETASAKAMTACLNNSAMMPCVKQIRELEAWAVYRKTGRLEPGMSKDWESRVGQIYSALGGSVDAILKPRPCRVYSRPPLAALNDDMDSNTTVYKEKHERSQ